MIRRRHAAAWATACALIAALAPSNSTPVTTNGTHPNASHILAA
jgi:hypothetical protein